MSSNILLARFAECIFWLARYMERAENLARILDVNETFSRDSQGGQNWLSIVQLHADERPFFARHQAAAAETVLDYYVRDAQNLNSIVSTVRSARANARTLRPLISTEMWVQLNVFYNRLRAISPADLASGSRARLFSQIKEACQTHTGITEGTFYRDQGWYFYQLGRYIERADQTTRLLDIKYHLLLPAVANVGSPIDVSQWNAVLRSAAGYHAFRRLHTSMITPARVVGFLLVNNSFPRSLGLCIHEAIDALTQLKSRYMLRGGNGAAEMLDQLHALLTQVPVQEILASGLHEFLDLVQLRLTEVTDDLSQAFFGYRPGLPSQQIQQA